MSMKSLGRQKCLVHLEKQLVKSLQDYRAGKVGEEH
jgi:hypothetical protein